MTLHRLPHSNYVLTVLISVLLMYGCHSMEPAPVTERLPTVKRPGTKPRAAKEGEWRPAFHTVQKGDTLYAVALEYGLDYKELAELNGLEAPYTIRVGQRLKLPGGTAVTEANGTVVTAPLKSVAVPEAKPLGNDALLKTQPKALRQPYSDAALAHVDKAPPKESIPPRETEDRPGGEKTTVESDEEDKVDWGWPATGKIVASVKDGNSKGVDIAGKSGAPVNAAAGGKVVYSGSGLRGYGKLIIIKHNNTFLSAYAHNHNLLVKEGQTVVKGQKIAEMGDSDADQVKLHFEIRRLGKPVDPMKYLPAEKTS